MAFKILLALCAITLARSNPIIVKEYIFRDGRGLAIGQAQAIGYGQAIGSVNVNNGGVNAYSRASTDNHYPLGQNIGYGQMYPGQAIANAQAYDASPYGSTQAVAQAHNLPTYYNLPAPASIVYEQNFNAPHVYGTNRAESSAIINGNSDSTITSTHTEGLGSAQANGIGSYGITTSNANSFGSGSASSNANTIGGLGSTSSRTQGFGSATSVSQNALGQSSSNSQSSGGVGYASSSNTLNSASATATGQGVGSAISNAFTNNGENVESEKFKNQKKLGWHLGASYNTPSSNHVQAASRSFGGSAESNAYSANGNIQTSADTQGHASANSNAGNGKGYANSVANGNGYGAAKTASSINGGSVRSDASVNGNAYAQSIATKGLNYKVNGNARTTESNASTETNNFLSIFPTGFRYYGGSTNSQSAQGVNASYRVADSSASSYTSGAAKSTASRS